MKQTGYGGMWLRIDKVMSPDGTWQDEMKLRDYAKKVLTKVEYKVFREHMKRIVYGGEIRQPYETIKLDRFLREVFRHGRNDY